MIFKIHTMEIYGKYLGHIYIYTRCTRAQAHTMMQGRLAGAGWQAGRLAEAGRQAGWDGGQAGWGWQAG